MFQVDTIKYYKKNGKEIESDINLDGLVAAYEQIYDFSKNPKYKLEVKEFDISLSQDSRVPFLKYWM